MGCIGPSASNKLRRREPITAGPNDDRDCNFRFNLAAGRSSRLHRSLRAPDPARDPPRHGPRRGTSAPRAAPPARLDGAGRPTADGTSATRRRVKADQRNIARDREFALCEEGERRRCIFGGLENQRRRRRDKEERLEEHMQPRRGRLEIRQVIIARDYSVRGQFGGVGRHGPSARWMPPFVPADQHEAAMAERDEAARYLANRGCAIDPGAGHLHADGASAERHHREAVAPQKTRAPGAARRPPPTHPRALPPRAARCAPGRSAARFGTSQRKRPRAPPLRDRAECRSASDACCCSPSPGVSAAGSPRANCATFPPSRSSAPSRLRRARCGVHPLGLRSTALPFPKGAVLRAWHLWRHHTPPPASARPAIRLASARCGSLRANARRFVR